MEKKLNLQISDLYGGDGNLRYIEIKEVKFTRKKTKKTIKQSTGVESENAVGEEQSELVKKDIQTFKFDEKGNPTYRFGGIHGKLWGHLRASGKMLADLGEEGFDSKAFIDRLMMTLNITPVNVVITDFEKIQTAEIPQIMNNISKSLIIQRFDYIPKCNITLTLTFPDMYKDRIVRILKQAEEMAGMNKRRATLKILNRKEIFGE